MGDSSRGLAELIINLLRERGELTSKEIAEILGVKRSSVTAVLARLRREGVVEYLGFCFGGNRCNTKWRLKMN
ncbi:MULTISPECIES: winged helix-turn-helix transcriptional regulator [Pyrobaculum]|uniref:Transcriptional regulator, ArsR family n=1 Tax=Pyrobaculum arsenaticum (strain DSM 13514 / JCM 11321 / PZ6) TaxID=340102 RepID=A4WNE0_PYRAR|nr:winged helix-turn-helix transcriptional regulator [Pyrobaculum arsenaticum]ABP51907.1 transcriptional regulator, ArsR family [Pyrobaculum arsenaticum DSM 13514]MCY0889366.1 winged helix-turn-helix transcriptional regulator [Pyrobaculum arsenaticum]